MFFHTASWFRAAPNSIAAFVWHIPVLGMGVGFALAASLFIEPASANPLGSAVTSGAASVSTSTNKAQVDQKSEGVVIDWSSFNIGSGQITQFVQPNAQAIAVNRVTGNAPSQIFGTLEANGRIVLINGNGVLFGRGSQVNVGSLVATSSDASDNDILSGNAIFTKAGRTNAAVVNQGNIQASQGGLVALVAPNVSNSGSVTAKLGHVALGASNQFTLDFTGDGLVSFATQGTGPASVNNTGLLAGAAVSLTARAAEGVATGVVNMSGTIVAQGAHDQGGTIVLDAGNGGTTTISGHAIAQNADGSGGTIIAMGKSVNVGATANLNADGARGGTILIGGDIHGGAIEADNFVPQTVATAATTNVARGALISADGSAGRGGNIVVWSDVRTTFGGQIDARGANGAVGGFAEVSSHDLLAFGGTVDLTADHGATGTLLLDPYNVIISAKPTKTETCSGTTCTPSGNNSNLNVTTLEDLLATSDVDVVTGYTRGIQAGNITVLAPITWSSGTTLTLDAYQSVAIDKSISITGGGGLDIVTDDNGGTGGALTFGPRVVITFDDLASQFSINGSSYKLVDSISGLASAIDASPDGDFAFANNYNAAGDGIYPNSPVLGSFEGILLGLGHTISGLRIRDIHAGADVGLFQELNGGTIDNLGLKGIKITGSTTDGNGDEGEGGLVGLMQAGNLYDDYVTGSITGGALYVGGLVGENVTGSISNSYSTATVDALQETWGGGLAGMNGGSIDNSYATGKVSAYNAGGLVGQDNGVIAASYATGIANGSDVAGGLVSTLFPVGTSQISDSYATGNVTMTSQYGFAGGLVGGINYSTSGGILIDNSYASGTVTGASDSDVGGLVGQVYAFNGAARSILNDSASGAVIGGIGSDAGGLIGANIGATSVESDDATGSVTVASGSAKVGGLIGYNNSTGSGIQSSYATGAVSAGVDSDAGGLIGDNTGTVGTFYSYATITGSYASGTVTGGGGSSVGGLVGYGYLFIVQSSWATGNVTGNGPDTDSNDSYVGGLVGRADEPAPASGAVSGSYATGAVVDTGSADVGGLVGLNTIIISDSYADSSVTVTNAAAANVGGLVGDNNLTSPGNIFASYAAGAVSLTGSPTASVGGLIGYASSNASSLMQDCYWDTSTTGITNLSQGVGNITGAAGVTGLTTAQFQAGLPTGFDSSIWGESPTINGGLPYLLASPPAQKRPERATKPAGVSAMRALESEWIYPWRDGR